MRGASDLGWSVRPVGVSVELAGGRLARVGRTFSFLEVQLWAVPIHCPAPDLAWRLARFMTSRGPHQRETEAHGLLPIRKDLQRDYPIVFRLDWMQHVLDASYRQVRRGSGDMPDAVAQKGLDRVYEQLRQKVVYGRPPGPPPTFESVRAQALEVARGR
jgi:hypothetical protein